MRKIKRQMNAGDFDLDYYDSYDDDNRVDYDSDDDDDDDDAVKII